MFKIKLCLIILILPLFTDFAYAESEYIDEIIIGPVETRQELADNFANNIGAERAVISKITYASENRGIWRNIDHHFFSPYIAAPILTGALKAFDAPDNYINEADKMMGQSLLIYTWDVEFEVYGIHHVTQNEKKFIVRCKLEESLNYNKVYLSKCQAFDQSGTVALDRTVIKKSLKRGGVWFYVFDYEKRPKFLVDLTTINNLTVLKDPSLNDKTDKTEEIWDAAPPLTSRPVPAQR